MKKMNLVLKGFAFGALLSLVFTGTYAYRVENVLAAPKADSSFEEAAVKVNVNTAEAQELENVRGIGPAIAQRIVQYRQMNGKFEKVEDLANVSGIGEAKLQKIRQQVTL